ncbi:MAG: hypothetical protein KF811_02590, partial [Dokdonella sp.]|nr:hypothetical protein [Dokdonella sp.]
LAMAVVGLVGFGAAGAAMAQCPASLSPPWSLVSTLQGTASSVTGGYDSTSCRLQTALNQNGSTGSKAFVLDQTPANEQRYRAQFIVDVSGLSLTQANRNVIGFSVLGASAPAGGTSRMLFATLTGNGSASILRLSVGDTAQVSQYQQVDIPLPNQAGANRIEIDLVVGNPGSIKYWVSNVSASTSEGSPTGSIATITNNGWTGVDQVTLGLVNANTFYRQNFGNTNFVYFDQFDSRRQTFIGH